MNQQKRSNVIPLFPKAKKVERTSAEDVLREADLLIKEIEELLDRNKGNNKK